MLRVRLKRKRIIILIVVIFVSVSATSFYLSNSISKHLLKKDMPGSVSQIQNGETKALQKTSDSLSIVVYYPDVKGKAGSVIKEQSQKLVDRIFKEEGNNKGKVDVNINGQIVSQTDELWNCQFSITKLENQKKSQKRESVWLYKSTGVPLDCSTLFDEKLLWIMTNDLRYACKSDITKKDIAYTKKFLDLTYKNPALFDNFTVEGDELLFTIDELQKELRLDLKKYASHLNVSFGVKQSIPDDVLYMPRRYIDPSRPMLVMTFDDGPHHTYTPEIIEAFRHYDGAASFFVVGNRIGKKTSPILINAIESGMEIGSHSWSHAHMEKTKKRNMEFEETTNKLLEVTQGKYRIKIFRPPYGAVGTHTKEESPYPFIMWNVDTEDWKTKNAKKSVNAITDKVKDGDIILMHDILFESKEAVEQVLPKLIDAGYQLVTVSEMLQAKSMKVEPGESCFSAK